MPGVSQAVFAAKWLTRDLIEGRRVLDVGAKNFNGSIRPLLEHLKPSRLLGVDIEAGAGVDRVLSANDLVRELGESSFDVVVCLEMLEHARHWQDAVSNMKRVLAPGGSLLLTTRSSGYPLHGFPTDFWRFEVDDAREIFGDLDIVAVESDPDMPGVFVFGHRRTDFVERELGSYSVSCILTGKRESSVPEDVEQSSRYRRLRLKTNLKACLEAVTRRCGRVASRVLESRG